MTIEEMNQRKREMGLTYAQIAERSGLPVGTVQKVLGGITKNPRYETVNALTAVFQTDDEKEMVRRGSIYYGYAAEHSDKHEPECSDGCAAEYSDGYAAEHSGERAAGCSDGCEAQQNGAYKAGKAGSRRHAEKNHKLLREPEVKYQSGGQGILYKPASFEPSGTGPYTNEDRVRVPENVHTELDDGWIIRMESPTTIHQTILSEIFFQLKDFVRKNHGSCQVYPSSTDVKLEERTTYVPDILVVCDQNKIHRDGIHGAPDLVVEILSRSTARRDLFIKAEKYRKSGVREYWMVDPKRERVLVYPFGLGDEEKTDLSIADIIGFYPFTAPVPVGIWDGKCKVDLSGVIDQIRRIEEQDD